MKFQEIEEIADRWERTGLLKHAEDDRLTLALILEGQVRYNEKHIMHPQFMRISIPLWVRIMRDFYDGLNVAASAEPLSEWMFFNTRYNPNEQYDGRQRTGNFNLDQEIEGTVKLADSLVDEIKAIGKPIMVHALAIEADGLDYRIKLNYEEI